MRRLHLVTLAIVVLGIVTAVVSVPGSSASAPPDSWQYVSSPADLGDGFVRGLWTGERGTVYLLASKTSSPPYHAVIYRWDGDWTTVVDEPGYNPIALYGTGPDDIYASMDTCLVGDSWTCPGGAYGDPNVVNSKLFHYDGGAWTEEALPTELQTRRIRTIAGTPGDIQIGSNIRVFRNTGSGWTKVYQAASGGLMIGPEEMTAVGPDEFYMSDCWGHGWWNGSTWTTKVEFDFCDLHDIWGARDGGGQLHLWVIGANNFSNGVRIWKYNEASHSFGSKYGYEFYDGSGYNIGSGTAIWGSAWDDVYATGGVYGSGRIYHNDGSGWTRLTAIADLGSSVRDVWGTGTGDVWFLISDGRLLHLGANEPPVADAGGPYIAAVSQTFAVDGTGSVDPDGDPLDYAWSFEGSDLSGATGSFAAPATAGIYPIDLTVDDRGYAHDDTASTSVYVYDPSAGFVTGGGWIDSPVGAYLPDASLAGKATFEFASKYQKKADVPTCDTEFVLDVAGLDFHSTSCDWLFVDGSSTNAQFMGTGTINDTGAYKFMLWASDKRPDTFRIKIWSEDESGLETVVYDNGTDQEIGRGNIAIHSKGK